MNHISIIIPFYKGENFLPLLLDSLKKSIEQCKNILFEIIIIIDSMDTDENDIIKITSDLFTNTPSISVVIKKNKKNIGVAGSRNLALQISNGEFLHIIDQDDLVCENFYSQIIPVLNNSNFVVVNGWVHYTNKKYNTHKLYYFAPKFTIKGLMTDDFIRSPGQVVFSKLLCQYFSFPEPKNNRGADDRFFWIRIFINNEKTIKPYYIKSPNYIANIHENNYSSDVSNLKRSALESWDIIQKENEIIKYNDLIVKDMIRLKFGLDRLSSIDKILGLWYNFKYFNRPNKLIRFLMKRKKW